MCVFSHLLYECKRKKKKERYEMEKGESPTGATIDFSITVNENSGNDHGIGV